MEVREELVRAHEQGKTIIPVVALDADESKLPWFLQDVLRIPIDAGNLVSVKDAVLKTIKEKSKPSRECYHGGNISWDNVMNYVKEIAEELKGRFFKPDVLVSFPKGGLIVADLLGHCFNNELEIVSIHTNRERMIRGEYVLKIRDHYLNYKAIKGKKILIIDDVLENGMTIRDVKKLLLTKGNIPEDNIKTAVLGRTKISDWCLIEPDISSFDYIRDDEQELFFPWGKVTL
jgi:hypoxanthine phosphoribosyltransferase